MKVFGVLVLLATLSAGNNITQTDQSYGCVKGMVKPNKVMAS